VSSLAARARKRLTEQLRQLLGDEVHRLVGGTHTRRFEDNLLSHLSLNQVETLRQQLLNGAGNELKPSRTGKRPAHAPYSSATFAVNNFGRWLDSESDLVIGGLSGFEPPLKFEAKTKIAYGGGTANLDVLVKQSGSVVGIESKLTEPFSVHDPVEWKSCYQSPEMATLLTGGWSELFKLSLAKQWQPTHLHIEQLLKHALALNSQYPELSRKLFYCYWEPENGGEFDAVLLHAQEIDTCREIIGSAEPTFVPLRYSDLWHEWEMLARPRWTKRHVDALRQRYAVPL
jgi:hypothetical protein